MDNKIQHSRINDALYEIHRDISVNLSAKALAKTAAYSEQHFHRVFHRVVGETVNTYIRRTRLEQVANQLMFDHNSSVLSIAEKCGFTSLSSFSKAFKARFGITPGKWRASNTSTTEAPYLADPEISAAYQRIKNSPIPEPKIVILDKQHVAYVRHKGYGRGIKKAWLLLQAWANQEGVTFESSSSYSTSNSLAPKNMTTGQQIGLYHSNPTWVELKHCHYVACIGINKPLKRRGLVNSLTIPGGIHAAFDLQGQYGELLPWIGKILEHWLPDSGYKLQTTPAFVHYKKNQFLANDDLFNVTLFLPISVH